MITRQRVCPSGELIKYKSMGNAKAIVKVVSYNGRIMRSVEVESFDEVLPLKARFPNCDIGVFFGCKSDGEMWTYFPDLDDPKPQRPGSRWR